MKLKFITIYEHLCFIKCSRKVKLVLFRSYCVFCIVLVCGLIILICACLNLSCAIMNVLRIFWVLGKVTMYLRFAGTWITKF